MWADGRLVAQPHIPGSAETKPATAGSVVLPHNTHRLEFTYTALSLTAPERVRFRHRLEAFDSNWTEAGSTRSIAYVKLPPGRYHFQVLACNDAGVWNETGHGLAFRVAAPFWHTWWFLMLTGAGLAGVLAAGARFVSVQNGGSACAVWRRRTRSTRSGCALPRICMMKWAEN
jgi:hypothetical protein